MEIRVVSSYLFFSFRNSQKKNFSRLILLCIGSKSFGIEIICEDIHNKRYEPLPEGFDHCTVLNDPKITSISNRDVSKVVESQEDVKSIGFEKKTVKYFPLNMKKFFKHLFTIEISSCGLKAIHPSDLEPFKQLKLLYLSKNEIEIIDEDLFMHNPELVCVYLNNNKIKEIHPDVFEAPQLLTNMVLNKNPCIDVIIIDDREKVLALSEQVRKNCRYTHFASTVEYTRSKKSDQESNPWILLWILIACLISLTCSIICILYYEKKD